MFNFLKNKFTTLYSQCTASLASLFGQKTIDSETIQKLEHLLLQADTGVKTTHHIISNLQKKYAQGLLKEGATLKKALEIELANALTPYPHEQQSTVYLLIGVNGSGKTTCAGKLAYRYAHQGKKVLLVAADTYRAAATEQLEQWALKINVDIYIGKPNQDPSSVVFAGCQRFKEYSYDILIIDTAGRLQTKLNLMQELAKIKRTLEKQLPEHVAGKKMATLLTIDGMLGQNSFQQAQLFHECTTINGIMLTKMDGTGKGGIVFAINQALKIPVAFITFGEQKETLASFDPQAYIQQLLSEQ